MSVPWKKRDEELPSSRAKQQRYMAQETRTAKKDGARKQLNSGRKWHSLRDVIQDSPIGRILIDNKDTESASYRITLDDWATLKRDANRTPPGCQPGLQLDIQNLKLFVIEDGTWDEITDYIKWLEGRLEELQAEVGDDATEPRG